MSNSRRRPHVALLAELIDKHLRGAEVELHPNLPQAYAPLITRLNARANSFRFLREKNRRRKLTPVPAAICQ